MKIYLVGGAVRDRLRGLEPADFDFVAIGGTEADLRRAVPGLVRVGQGIPVFVRGAEQYTLSAYPDIEADLASRDLTINALAQDAGQTVLAHPLALADLEERILRPVAAANFLADPLRAVRAARFAATLPDFSIHPDLLAAMRQVPAAALGSVAAERVGQEILKACSGPVPGNLLRTLCAGQCLSPWLEELALAAGIPAGPPRFHDKSVLEHTAQVMDQCAGDALAVWMALCHDLGKTNTPADILPRHPGHEQRGEALAQSLAQRLRLPKNALATGRLAARWHMAAGLYEGLRQSTKVGLLLALDRAKCVPSFFRLVAADRGGDHLAQALADLAIIRATTLPEKHRNLGPKSAEILLQRRCEALAEAAHRRSLQALAP